MDNKEFLKKVLAVVEKQQAALKKMASINKQAQSGLKGDPLDWDAAQRDLGYPILDSKDYGKKQTNTTAPPQSLEQNKSTHVNDAAMSARIKAELKSPAVANVGVDQAKSVVTVKFNPGTPEATKDQVFKTLQQVAGKYVGHAKVQEVA